MEDNKHEALFDAIKLIKSNVVKFCTDWAIKGKVELRNQIRFSENQIDINKTWDNIRLELFLSRKRRTMDITINDLAPRVIERTLKNCEKLLKIAKINTNYKKLPEGSFKYNKRIQSKIYDENVVNLKEKAVDLVEESIEASLEQKVRRIAGIFFYGKSEIYLENSKGLEGNYKISELNFRIRAFGEDMYASGEALSCSTHLNHDFSPIKAGEEAGMICNQSTGWKKGKPGIYNIIIYPKVSTELQAPTPAIAMNYYVQKMGLGWLVGKKEGDKIANDVLSVWDDGTADYGLFSSVFDDEFVPRKKNLLIDKGVLNQFFTNTSLSKKDKESTGNAGITMPKPSNTVFSTGDCTLKELMEMSEKPTLLITSTWYTRYQSYAPPGVFSSLPKDGMFLIKDKGTILEPIRELRINSDHLQMLENTVALGKNLKQVSTWLSPSENPVFAPFMLIENIRMTTGTK
jgi:predicted Zn-dependent protease